MHRHGFVSPLRIAKKIYDEVHGYIELTEVEKNVVDLPIFQRLRFVKQLAAAWYVYPGATHTRFSHSLGAMHIMGLIASRLYSMGYIHDKDDVQLLRLAALLHDIGHPPFSHATESFYRERLGFGHEGITCVIIMENYDLKTLLDSYGYDAREIAAIIEGRHRESLFNQLVSSDLDVDRMDYLLRDALHTGVAYGTIDLQRLLTTIVVDGDGRLAVLEKGVEALENFYLARRAEKTSFWRALREIYDEARRGVIKLRDPNPPKTFARYLLSSAYSLWLWTAVVLTTATIIIVYASEIFPWLRIARYLLGTIFVLFLPGYALIEALYPEEESLSPLERLALSIGLSLAIVPLIGLLLNYSPWGIRLVPIVTALSIHTFSMLILASYRKYRIYKLAMLEEH